MKTKIMILAMLGCLAGIAYAQNVFNDLQQRIQNDQSAISLDQQDIGIRNADIQNVTNDPAYNVAQAEAVSAQASQANVDASQVNSEGI